MLTDAKLVQDKDRDPGHQLTDILMKNRQNTPTPASKTKSYTPYLTSKDKIRSSVMFGATGMLRHRVEYGAF